MSIAKPTSYEDIKMFSEKLKSTIDANGIPLGLKNFPLYIRMETEDNKGLKRLMDQAKCKNFIAVLGIDNDDKFTVSFLAIGKDNKVEEKHYKSADGTFLKGEETWPRTSITFYKPEQDTARDILP